MSNHIKKVAIAGGTHGNELTGIYLVNRYIKSPELIRRSTFETVAMHMNLKAMEQCTRYVDKDLNRTFSKDALADTTLTSYEDKLAKEINQKIGPKGSKTPNIDFIIDLHTTTSNMNLSICISSTDELTWQAIAYVKECLPELNIFRWKGDTDDASFVSSIPPRGFTVEVGPIPQGVLRADVFLSTERVVQATLDFFELHNTGKLEKKYTEVEIYDHIKLVDFPRDEDGNIIAMIHADLQDVGYKKINKGDPLFMQLNGESVNYEEEDEVYALFVNEAAYYEKGFAMCLTDKKVINI